MCCNAIGVEYISNRKENSTLIVLGPGNDTAIGTPDFPNIFVVDDGNKNYIGGSQNDTFILRGDNITGTLKGGSAVNMINLREFALSKDNMIVNLNQGYIDNPGFKVSDMSIVIGRNGKNDRIISTCNMEYIDGYGGEDTVIIEALENRPCTGSTHIIIRPTNIIYNNAPKGSFFYILPYEQREGKALIILNNNGKHNFLFNYTLSQLKGINFFNDNKMSEVIFRFSLSSNKTSNLVISSPTSGLEFISKILKTLDIY